MKNERQQLIKQAEGSKDQSGNDKLQPVLLVGPKKLKPANGNKSLEASSHKDIMRYETRPPNESTKCVNLRFILINTPTVTARILLFLTHPNLIAEPS